MLWIRSLYPNLTRFAFFTRDNLLRLGTSVSNLRYIKLGYYTSNLHLKKLQVLQNKCLRIIEGWKIKQKLAPFYLKYEILSLNQLLKFEIAKFMHRYWKGKQPDVFNDYFQLVKTISSYSCEKKYFYLPLVKTK